MKKRKPSNPFLLTGYHSPRYFCDREEEYQKLHEALKNERNITLFSLRRMGKTALLRHLFHHLEKDKQYKTLYTDILSCESLHDMTQKLATAVIQKYGRLSSKGLTATVTNFIKNLGASLEMDSITGMPSIKLHYHDQQNLRTSFQSILRFLSTQKEKIVLAFDEFQQITRFGEDNVEAFMRSMTQEHPEIRFIYSGSHRNIMMSMFSHHGKPFYRSTQLFELQPIDRETYTKFIQHHFQQAGKTIDREFIAKIFDWTAMQTYYVQLVCNRLYALDEPINKEVLHETFVAILQEEQAVFNNYRNLLSPVQWRVLVALAKEAPVSEPTNGYFLRKYNISAPSTMTTALRALEKKELILRMDNHYIVHDVLLMRWIQYMVEN
jgi:AAA+ ATPase superfamily predicted ATPase